MKQQVHHPVAIERHYLHVHPSHKVLIAGGFVFASVLFVDLISSLSKILG